MVLRLLLNSTAFLIATLFIIIAILNPWQVKATGSAADAMCAGCQMDPKQPMYCPTVYCSDVTSGFTTAGTCAAPGVCLGSSTGGPNGFGLGQVAQILGPLMQALMQGSQNGSASPTDTTLPAPCQTAAPTGVAAQILASTTASSTNTTPGPCDLGTTNPLLNSFTTPILGGSVFTSGTSAGDALTSALGGSSCSSSDATCGISSIANQLGSAISNAPSSGATDTSGLSLVPNNAIVPTTSSSSATTTLATTTVPGQVGIFNTGSNIAPQGLTIGNDGSAIIFAYAPVGQNAQIAGFISCNVSAANAIPYVPLSAIQNACK